MGITRRTLLQATVAGSALSQTSGRLPNIVFLISDDHSAPDLGCYGNTTVRTPNLDRLAREGCRYDRCYVSSPQCSPNRSSIFTSQYPHTTSTSRLHTPMPSWQPSFLEPLKEKGYFAGAFRKVHQGADFDKRWNFYGDAKTSFEKFFDAAPSGKPFFLHVGFTDPHRPYKPGAFQPAHDPAKVQIPKWLPDTKDIRQDIADYYDAIARMDAEAGQILKLLADRGLAENTLVVFTGDNGMPFPPRAKGTLYESGIRVPLLARWPGRIQAGSNSAKLVAHIDLPVTWLAAANIPKPDRMLGIDFLTSERKEIFSERNWHDNFDLCRCIRTDRYKLIYNGLPSLPYRPIGDLAASPTWASFTTLAGQGRLNRSQAQAMALSRPMLELYDLQSDAEELTNLIDRPEHASIQEDLLRRLGSWMDNTYDFLPPPFREFPAGSGNLRSTL